MELVIQTLRSALATTAERWIALTQSLPVEMLTQPPAQGEWSAVECLQHIVDSEKVFQFRVQAFLEGRDIPGFDPDTEGTQSGAGAPRALAEEFVALRRASLDSLAKLGSADLARKSKHSELGPVTLSEMVHEWVAHDLNHTMQAEKAVMQPFIRACGPWQVFFTNHLMEG